MDFIIQVAVLFGIIVMIVFVAALWTYSDMRKKKDGDEHPKPEAKVNDHVTS